MDKNLLEKLVRDEKSNNKELYSAGPYWNYKNTKALHEIKKKGLSEFRGINSGITTSFGDNIVFDARNELNLKGRIVSKFLSLPLVNIIFKEQLRATKVNIDRYIKNLAIVYQKNEDVIRLIKKYEFENTTEFGCIQKFSLDGKDFSTHYLQMADRIDKLQNKFDFKKIKSFFEIGGGFGVNVHFIISNFPNIKKILYLDIVPNIFVGTEYLRHFYGKSVKDYLQIKDLKEISFSNDDSLEIICVPPWEIEKLKIKIDHFHNAASFVEMPKKVIDNYCKYIEKFHVKEISLISYEYSNSKTTFNPELLNNFFNNKLNVEWKDNLIKEYNDKLVFLTSN
tara:strand:- start:1387 stop:2400 length:1014 start_codon:yes stop_codon:yes gene_type:complete